MTARRNNPSPPPAAVAARAMQGRAILSGEQWQAVAEALKLSGRELQILGCIFEDRTERGVARELGISCHTVHTHIERLYRKLGATCRCAAVVRVFAEYLAIEAGMRQPVGKQPDSSSIRSPPVKAPSKRSSRPPS